MGLISVIFMGMILRIVLMAGWSHMMRQRSTNRIAKVEWQRVTSSKSMILIRDSAEAARIREKYPNRIPVIVEKAERSDIPNIDKKNSSRSLLESQPSIRAEGMENRGWRSM
ncbi:uncharacterized protein LOC133031079 isoform X2 [Cannabis sativa]|uniref:uncharacterized protein LOC133031079 isoform X2 n=1 Tax=Cannabis sativa TaxID=3483 RepID=UPI0029CA671D|nr:uncharacterized protein LOC133031079 isoform X2 [Cannabis sativa]